jgi:glycosyltransferase involved in cell wall biosynthesis
MVFVSYWCTEYVLALIWIKRKYPDVKIYSRFHAWDVYFERNYGGYLPFRKLIFDELNKAYMISEDGRNFILQRFPQLNPEKFKVSHLGVLPAANIPARNPNQPFRMLSLSFVSRVKRLERIVGALEKVDFPLHWIHIGDGGAEFLFIKALAEEKLSKNPFVTFEFLGKLNKGEVNTFLDTHFIDVLVNSSETEGIPVSIMECMSRGIPAIGPSVGGIPEIIENGKSGKLLSKVTNENEILEAINYFHSLSDSQTSDYRLLALETWNKKFNAEVNYPELLQELIS